MNTRKLLLALGAAAVGACSTARVEEGGAVTLQEEQAGEDESRLSDQVIPPRVGEVPARPRPVLELGDPFLGEGPIRPGVPLPTGSVLQPSFLVFGTLRTALQAFDAGDSTTSEWASRLDLHGNLQLSGTERVLAGVRPLDREGRFTSHVFESPGEEGWEEELNLEVTTLFFEGDLGEMFPGLDPGDSGSSDWGLAVGRQPLLVQDGLLIDDSIDSIGLVRNTLLPSVASNLRLTALLGWGDVHRDDNLEDRDALLFALFGEADLPTSTVTLGTVYVHDEDDRTDALYLGAGAVQRLGHVNTAFRVVSSFPAHDDTPAVSRGTLLFAELSRNPTGSDDLCYLDAFWGIDEFSSAARGPDRGGPLGRTGILFAAVGLGQYGAALGNRADESFGGALGYQSFLGDEEHRRQLILELGAREETSGPEQGAVAAGLRYQQAFGRHVVLRLDGFVAGRDGESSSSGIRTELVFKL